MYLENYSFPFYVTKLNFTLHALDLYFLQEKRLYKNVLLLLILFLHFNASAECSTQSGNKTITKPTHEAIQPHIIRAPEYILFIFFVCPFFSNSIATTSDVVSFSRWQFVFPPGKSGREISEKFGVLKFTGKFMSGSWEILFSILEGFSGTDMCHSDAKMRSWKAKKFFLLVKDYFSKFPKFFTIKCSGDQKVFL